MVLLIEATSEVLEGIEARVLSSPVRQVIKSAKEDDLKASSPNECYQVRDIPGKGMGLFATRYISAGELILREKPLILMPKKIFDDDDPFYIEQWLDRRINRLTSEERHIFYSLADSRFFDGENKSSLGIFYTNDMTFTDDSAALFPTMARSNHSCIPNSDFVARDKLGVQDLVATRSIDPDEEITLCYLPSSGAGSDVRSLRQKYTRKWYGFNCACQACTLEGRALEEDEKLRNRVKMFQLIPFESLSLEEIEEFLDAIIKIGLKLPYLVEIAQPAFERALQLNNKILAAKFLTICYTASSIMMNRDDPIEANPFHYVLESQIIEIGDSFHLFRL